MLPLPADSARWIFLCSVLLFGTGLMNASAWTITLGGCLTLILATSFARTVPLGRKARKQGLEFAWWLEMPNPKVRARTVISEAPFEVHCYVRNQSSNTLRLRNVRPRFIDGVQLLDDPTGSLRLSPRTETEFTLRLATRAAGRVVLHGLEAALEDSSRLFVVPLYFPNPLTIRALPHGSWTAQKLKSRSGETRGLQLDQPSGRRGRGTELFELRELAPGDSFGSIAWKASARRDRLMVREPERDVQETLWTVVDVSGSMRMGTRGQRKLDFAIEIAAAAIRRGIDRGGRVGLIASSQRIVTQISPSDGRLHLLRLLDALTDATEPTEEDLEEIEKEELANLVANYMLRQDGVDFRGRKGKSPRDLDALARHVRRALPDEPRPCAIAPEDAAQTLRRFCVARAIPVPHRQLSPAKGTKGAALAQALHRASSARDGPCSILMVSDLDSIEPFNPVLAALRTARHRTRDITCVLTDASSSIGDGPLSALRNALNGALQRKEHRRLSQMRAVLSRSGIPSTVARREPPADVIYRALKRSNA
ncbi:MAG: DUF58 domain-containing protein [Myxococcota bacterium]